VALGLELGAPAWIGADVLRCGQCGRIEKAGAPSMIPGLVISNLELDDWGRGN
jgi:hypothetical protein